MKIIALIPARAGSKGISSKNIKKLGKYPLIAYSIAAAKLSKYIEEIIVTTDSEHIAEISRKYGAEVPFLRPTEISQDYSTDMEFFEHFISFNKNNKLKLPDYIVHLRPTSPLRDIEVLDEGIEHMLSNNNATGLRSVYPSSISPFKIFLMEGSFLKGFFPDDPRDEYYNLPRQAFPQTYIPNGYVDIVKPSTLESGVLHGNKLLGYLVNKVPDIDVEEDFVYAAGCLNDARFSNLINGMEILYG
ncbi:MAG: acylneuraminate cytidylyltransferase family protein [Candidatus Marinimicrobia bacterium]|nr:acylneuraminate cytidylyltransferase family protein [Candidatus Neomarinimicrobiota bacterium]